MCVLTTSLSPLTTPGTLAMIGLGKIWVVMAVLRKARVKQSPETLAKRINQDGV